jgi:SAM-dependent methyltransferase
MTRFTELLRGKSFGRAAMNVLLARYFSACAGRWLDIGGGQSPSYLTFLPKDCERIATDLTAGVGINALDANKPFPFPDANFDGAFALNMMYIARDPLRTLQEIHRVVKPGGLLFATFPFFFLENPEPHDYHRWTKEGVSLLLQNAGFDEIQILAVGGSGTAFSMTLMPGRGWRIVRLLTSPGIFLWDLLSKNGPVCFWFVSARVSFVS